MIAKPEKIAKTIFVEKLLWEKFQRKIAAERGLDKGVVAATIEDLIRIYLKN